MRVWCVYVFNLILNVFFIFCSLLNVFVLVSDYKYAAMYALSSRLYAEPMKPTFECMKCGRGYKYSASLHNHERNECNKLPRFQCPLCSYRSKQKGNLKTHMQKQHANEFTEKLWEPYMYI